MRVPPQAAWDSNSGTGSLHVIAVIADWNSTVVLAVRTSGTAPGTCAHPAKGEPVNARRSRSVLCIGTDPIALNFRCSLLKENGWTVLSSGSGHSGVFLFQTASVDVVVLDLNGDGSELALIAGALKRIRPAVPIVVLVAEPATLNPDATNQAAAVIAKAREKERLVALLEEFVPEA
jgi:CheY-like chemotaxis protein